MGTAVIPFGATVFFLLATVTLVGATVWRGWKAWKEEQETAAGPWHQPARILQFRRKDPAA
jgi:predicted negative regulator of RcsB-dependent stress response